MSAGLAIHMPSSAAVPADGWTPERVQLLRDTIARGCTNDEFMLFLEQCRRSKLDPFAKQIYAVKRWDSGLGREAVATQVSIDGFRLIAERSGEYEGQTPPEWCGPDGVWRSVWLDDAPPSAARIGVYRRGFREAVVAVATLRSYAQRTKAGGLSRMWAGMPDVMLSKCAEALALRKAFPHDLSGYYTAEEMSQADAAPVVDEHVAEQQAAHAKAIEADCKLVDEWRPMLDACGDAESLAKWVHFHAGELDNLVPKARARAWAALRKSGARVGVSEGALTDKLREEIAATKEIT
jgi:phage recombination protein Bet